MSVQRGINLGVALFIVSEGLFFLAIFWAFFHSIEVKISEGWLVNSEILLISLESFINLEYLCSDITLIHIAELTSNIRDFFLSPEGAYILSKELFNNHQTLWGSIKNSSFPVALGLLALRCNNIYRKYGYSRPYSSQSNVSKSFNEWLCGLTDGEGNFYIKRRSADTSVYSFKFSIGVHIDDKDMLIFIQKTLGIGKVYTTGKVAQYEVFDLKGVAKIIEIFTQYPLNSTKLLNFLDFKKAFELYRSPDRKSDKVVQEIAKIKSGMNSQRTNFNLPDTYKPRITPYWLLGFVEGEGSFSVVKGYGLTFSICQSSIDSVLMKAIKDFLNNLSGGYPSDEDKGIENDNVVYLGTYMGTANKEITRITISQIGYIRNILIPFFEGMIWRSKKYYDFQDWVNILKLRDRCHHYEKEGKKLMDLIASQMNNNRLSTKGGVAARLPNRAFLLTSIERLLSGPSNCEVREGKIWIISLNRFRHKGGLIKPMAVQLQDQKGNIIKTFNTQKDCADSFGVTRTAVAYWMLKSKPVLFEDKIVYITKVEEREEE